MRDFFYNKGDVLLAVLIILAAAFVIYLRVGVIMDYSPFGNLGEGLLTPPSANGESAAVDSDAEANEGADVTVTEPEEPAQNETTNPPTTAGTTGEEPVPEEEPGQSEPPPQSGQPVQIVVNSGDAASTIADKLLAAGAITDKQAFLSDVIAQGADSKLKTGTFTIPAGARHSDIIAILVG
jgi:hypothetical protein